MCVQPRDCARDSVFRVCDSRRMSRVCVAHRAGPRVQVPAVVRAMSIPALTAMLASGTEADGGVNNAMVALRVICAAPEGRDAAVAAGVPAAVTVAMATCTAAARKRAAFALSNM